MLAVGRPRCCNPRGRCCWPYTIAIVIMVGSVLTVGRLRCCTPRDRCCGPYTIAIVIIFILTIDLALAIVGPSVVVIIVIVMVIIIIAIVIATVIIVSAVPLGIVCVLVHSSSASSA